MSGWGVLDVLEVQLGVQSELRGARLRWSLWLWKWAVKFSGMWKRCAWDFDL